MRNQKCNIQNIHEPCTHLCQIDNIRLHLFYSDCTNHDEASPTVVIYVSYWSSSKVQISKKSYGFFFSYVLL